MKLRPYYLGTDATDFGAITLDPREIDKRIGDLEDYTHALHHSQQEYEAACARGNSANAPTPFDVDAALCEELDALCGLRDEIDGYQSWQQTDVLINETHFVDYIVDLIHDCYEIPRQVASGAWPYRYMKFDYEGAAREAAQDYNTVDAGGHTWLYRV